MTLKRKLAYTFLLTCIVWLAGCGLFAWLITCEKRKPVILPEKYQKITTDVSFKTTDGFLLSGWLLQPENTDYKKSVILAHGHAGTRMMLNRADLYLKSGYTILTFDFRAHGKSEGKYSSFGYHEQNDVNAAYDFLKNRGFTSPGFHGNSMGAVAGIYSWQHCGFKFMVLESPYDTIRNAANNRVQYFTRLNDYCFWPVYWFAGFFIHASIMDINPIEKISEITCPILYFAAENEYEVTKQQTEQIFSNITAPKTLYIIKGATHNHDYMDFDTKGYSETLNRFLETACHP